MRSMMDEASVDLHYDVRQLLKWRLPKLRFDRIEEAHFNHASGPARLRHFIISGWIALMGYMSFLQADYTMIRDVYDLAFSVRVYRFLPAALVLFAFGIFHKRMVLLLPTFVLETLMMCTGLGAAFTMVWLLMHSHSPYSGMYVAGLAPIVVYGNIVQRFRFRYALFFSLSVIAMSLVCALIRMGTPHPYAYFDFPLAMLVSVIASHTLVMNYRYELEERRRFQWSVRAQKLRKQLAASEAQLEEMSRRDPLTGVPNRRHFDQYLRQSWDAAQSAGGELALLLMDVDHFKAYNDHYGHPAGDQCLRHVAKILQDSVPAEQGCVARWGGEEFIVALPGMTAQQASVVAQSLVDAVRSSGLRHEASKTASCVTISVGVAVVKPAASGLSVDGLVAQADAALYQAKHAGRNRQVLAKEAVAVA